MINKVHLAAGFIATLTIASFFSSTLLVEIFCSREVISTVKNLIVLPGLLILIPAIAIAEGTGFFLSKSRKGLLVEKKRKSMPIVVLICIFVLLPTTIFLDMWASNESFGTKFYILQIIEIVAGGITLLILGFNIRDGLRLSGRLRS